MGYTKFYFVYLLVLLSLDLNSSQPIVSVEQGDVLGETITCKEDEYINVEKDVDVFKAIPFAEAPVGEQRFRPPVAKEKWDGVWNATYDRPVCIQGENPQTDMLEKSEDCLYLAVYAPSPKPTNASVMVWIHGGSFTSGAGSSPRWIATPLVATGDVIVVNINYRLGIFGFLSTGDDASPGNYGMMDQVEALRWVQRNIHAFGGDPKKVTVFGGSAGAAAIDLHYYSPLSADLFQRGIIQSGFAHLLFTVDVNQAREAAFGLDDVFECNAVNNAYVLLECLREVSAQELLQASADNNFLNNPCVDGFFIDDLPTNLRTKQEFKRTDLLLGNNAEEASFFLRLFFPPSPSPPSITWEVYNQIIINDGLASDGYRSQLFVEAVNQVYVDWASADDPNADYFTTLSNVATDDGFICPMDEIARAHEKIGDTVYQYHYTHTSSVKKLPGWTTASHTEELQYVFGWAFNPVLTDYHRATEEEKKLAVNVMKYWSNFAKYGNPNFEESGDLHWPRYTNPGLQYQEIAVNITTRKALKADECHFWNKHLQHLGTFLGDLSAVEQEWREEFNSWKYDDMVEWRHEFDKYLEAINAGK